jgi:GT2 family glycosyltransferase
VNGPLRLDSGVRILDDGLTVVGGDPLRILRLTPAGAATLRTLLGAGASPAAQLSAAGAALSRRLTDAGIAHPAPTRAATDDVTVVVPVRDRAEALDRCLAAAGAARRLVVDDGSADPAAIAAVCARHDARLIRRPVAAGPGPARNAAIPHLDTDLVAFLDSDCVPDPGWLEALCGVLADPEIAAAAPRIRPLGTSSARSGATRPGVDPPGVSRSGATQPRASRSGVDRPGPVARFAAARSPLDLGDRPGPVGPGGRITYVPTAALLVRRSVLGGGFDPDLRYGEDVDLIWRMRAAGLRVRYAPEAIVGHTEPAGLAQLLARRFAYGTSAGPLARRHPGRLAPVVLHPRPAAVIALAAAGSPRLAAGAGAVYFTATARALSAAGLDPPTAVRLATRGLADTAVAIGRSTTMLAPPLLAAGLAHRRTRPGALALLLAEPLRAWMRTRPPLDPVRWAALSIADDVAYGAGVWAGAVRARTLAPLWPTIKEP